MLRIAVGTLAVLAFASSAAMASSITISYDAGDGCAASVAGVGSLAYSNRAPLPCQGQTLGAVTDFEAQGSLQELRLYFESFGTTTQPYRVANVTVTDTVTVNGGTGPGVLTLDWLFNGVLDTNSDNYFAILSLLDINSGAVGSFRACGTNVAFARDICFNQDPIDGIQPADPFEEVADEIRAVQIPFTFGTPFTVRWTLAALIGSGFTAGE